MKPPADNLKDAINACDPMQALPADDERYVDLSKGRSQEQSPIGKYRNLILASETPTTHLFAGHIGCGKSTELKRLCRTLEEAGYAVAYFDAEGDIDLEDTEPIDILLALIRNVEATVRKEGVTLDSKLMEDFLLWFAEIVLEKKQQTEIEAEAKSEIRSGLNVPLLARFLAVITGRVKTGTESKKVIRQRLDPQVSQLIDRGNDLIEAARHALRKKGKKDLVLVVDSLDKISPTDRGNGRTAHEVIYIERGALLRSFRCHVVYTVPISLLYSPKQPHLRMIFPAQYVLPMVKITQRGNPEIWEPGRKILLDLLAKRLDPATVFDSPNVPELLVDASGGHPRILMNLVWNALASVDVLPLTAKVARASIRHLVNDYGRSIPEEHWPLLAHVSMNQTVKNDPAHQMMLFNLSVLEYQNEERWCNVHPAVRELPRFRDEVKALQKP